VGDAREGILAGQGSGSAAEAMQIDTMQ